MVTMYIKEKICPKKQGPKKSDWLFPGQRFPIFGLVSVSLPVQPTEFAFHVCVCVAFALLGQC